VSPSVSDGVDPADRRRRRRAERNQRKQSNREPAIEPERERSLEREPRSNYGAALVLPTVIHHRERIGLPQHVTVHETDGSGYSQQLLDSLPYKFRPTQSKGFLSTVFKTLRATAPSRSASRP
jgi:hypothetical protein